jgi:hypothetical protein
MGTSGKDPASGETAGGEGRLGGEVGAGCGSGLAGLFAVCGLVGVGAEERVSLAGEAVGVA